MIVLPGRQGQAESEKRTATFSGDVWADPVLPGGYVATVPPATSASRSSTQPQSPSASARSAAGQLSVFIVPPKRAWRAAGKHMLGATARQHLIDEHFTVALWNVFVDDGQQPEGWELRAWDELRKQDWPVVVVHDYHEGMQQLPGFVERSLSRPAPSSSRTSRATAFRSTAGCPPTGSTRSVRREHEPGEGGLMAEHLTGRTRRELVHVAFHRSRSNSAEHTLAVVP